MTAPTKTRTNGGPQQLAECGTEGAYRRHLRHNARRRAAGLPEQPIDEACRRAHQETQAAYENAHNHRGRHRKQAIRREYTRTRKANRLPDDAGYDTDGWRQRAACHGGDPHLFDHIGSEPMPHHREAAQTYCARCPVIQQCADSADRRGEPGVWGGSYRNGNAHGFHPLTKHAPPRRLP